MDVEGRGDEESRVRMIGAISIFMKAISMRFALAICALSSLLAACAPAKPVATLVADSTGRIHFQSLSLTAEQFTGGVQNVSPVTISGELVLPRRAARIPAMILLHGSGGVTETETGWSRELADFGVATFLLDSYSGRGITGWPSDPSARLHLLANGHGRSESKAARPWPHHLGGEPR